MYYPYSENKGADQLRGYRAADLRLCFRIYKKPVFSRRGIIRVSRTVGFFVVVVVVGGGVSNFYFLGRDQKCLLGLKLISRKRKRQMINTKLKAA